MGLQNLSKRNKDKKGKTLLYLYINLMERKEFNY